MNTDQHYEAIVLGTGGVGSAALYHLSQRGLRVLGLDAHPAGHDRGSSHGETRIIRQAYFEHPDYVPLAVESYTEWAQLQSLTGGQLLDRTGLIQIGPDNGKVIAGVLKSAEQHGLDVEQWTRRQAYQRFPQFTMRDDWTAIFEAAGGVLHVEAAVKAHLSAAIANGAQWRQAVVQGWQSSNSTVTVRTADETLSTDRLIIAAGPWATEMIPSMSQHFHVLAKRMYWHSAATSMSRMNCAAYLFELPHGIFYGFPSIDGQTVKIAEHSGGDPIVATPDDYVPSTPSVDQSRVEDFVIECLPQVEAKSQRQEVCYYTMSPDDHFAVGWLPGESQVLIAAGMSGHGFKFTPVIGRALADLACNGHTDLPIGFLDPARWE